MHIMMRGLLICVVILFMHGNGWSVEMPWEKDGVTKGEAKRTFAQLPETDRQAVLDCICKCNSTANLSLVRVYYTTAPSDASPACSDTQQGPCVNQGNGCWRHFPPVNGNCMTQCAARYDLDTVPNEMLNAGR